LRSSQVGVGKADDEELVRVRNLVAIGIGYGRQEVVVVGNPEGVVVDLALLNVRAKRDALDFRWNVAGGYATRGEKLDEIHEQRLTYREGECVNSVHVADVGGAGEIDFKKLFDNRIVGTATAVAIAFIDEEFVIVEGENLTDA
jgi:hypothetical protein